MPESLGSSISDADYLANIEFLKQKSWFQAEFFIPHDGNRSFKYELLESVLNIEIKWDILSEVFQNMRKNIDKVTRFIQVKHSVQFEDISCRLMLFVLNSFE